MNCKSITGIALLRASRPNFLILSLLCAWLGIVLAQGQGVRPGFLESALVLTGALLAHAAVNLLNEYEDFRSGLDLRTARTRFSGGSGALPTRPQAASYVAVSAYGCVVLTAVIGVFFIKRQGLALLGLGGVGMALVMGYTRWATRSPWVCLLAPGVGFGPVMLLGSVLALGGKLDPAVVVVAVVVMCLASELLLLNQLPDIEADRSVGRRHLAIAHGARVAAQGVVVLLVSAYSIIAVAIMMEGLLLSAGLALIPLPGALWVARALSQTVKAYAPLTPILGANVATILATLGLLGLGLSLAE
ncbi:prenyltransferase [Litchfieldella xinjiangensis]|uniref:prenyltransferase n=1 Tax=Litchfieldella xinjiangensis TaxID=1166948 RepID=UPI0005B998B0|nr:prenyltransferase [Halomonas xinjiangensis]